MMIWWCLEYELIKYSYFINIFFFNNNNRCSNWGRRMGKIEGRGVGEVEGSRRENE